MLIAVIFWAAHRSTVIVGVAFVAGTVVMDQEEQAYPRPCPVCRVAMIGENDDPKRGERRSTGFVCLSCGIVHRLARSQAPAAERTPIDPTPRRLELIQVNAAMRHPTQERSAGDRTNWGEGSCVHQALCRFNQPPPVAAILWHRDRDGRPGDHHTPHGGRRRNSLEISQKIIIGKKVGKDDWPEYVPANFTVPANRLIQVTVRCYDDGAPISRVATISSGARSMARCA